MLWHVSALASIFSSTGRETTKRLQSSGGAHRTRALPWLLTRRRRRMRVASAARPRCRTISTYSSSAPSWLGLACSTSDISSAAACAYGPPHRASVRALHTYRHPHALLRFHQWVVSCSETLDRCPIHGESPLSPIYLIVVRSMADCCRAMMRLYTEMGRWEIGKDCQGHLQAVFIKGLVACLLADLSGVIQLIKSLFKATTVPADQGMSTGP